MPEIIVRFVVWVIVEGLFDLLEYVGRIISRTIIPLVTFGRARVAPLPGNLIVVERWHGLHRLTDGQPVMGERLASIVGLLVLTVALAAATVGYALLRR